MTRWHPAGCRVPDIEVRGRGPFCRACGAEPDLQTLIAAKQNDSPFPPCPPDELPGKFNFSWPATVPYTSSGGSRTTDTVPQNTPTPGTADASSGESRHSNLSPTNSTYPSRLRPDELRLIILPASVDHTYPMHVDLETHQDDRCPEYETVSYSWGGESGDSSSYYPLFVGRYWDVLLLTKNCWNMLQFLRPWRGSRMVWVDSICINQDDVQEREAQVAKMARIYSECRQVVVYLGEDVVKITTPGQYPPRRQLEDSIENLQVDFFGLLMRRYFSRVWIIQELILPRQIVIPVGEMEVCADKQSGQALSSRYNWNATAAPWVVQIGQRTLPFHQGNIYDILRLTCRSNSTDPRDKVFGAHALINNSENDRWALRPDYSLSCLHVFFGVFAHSLIKLKRTALFCNAAGISAQDGYPSWTPDWTSPGSIETWFQRRPLVWKTNRETTWDSQKAGWREWDHLPEWWTGEAFRTWWKGRGEGSTSSTKSVMHVSAEARQWRTPHSMRWDEAVIACSWDSEVPLSLFSIEANDLHARSRLQRRWDRDAAVDALTGSLSLQLIHLFSFQVVPEWIGTELGAKIFRVTAAVGEAQMYLTTDDFALEQHVKPGLDHLFLLDSGDKIPPLYLVMRKSNNAAKAWTYRLLGCCYHLCFYADPGSWTRRSVQKTYERWDYSTDESIVERKVPRLNETLFLADLQPNLQDTIDTVRTETTRSEVTCDDKLKGLFIQNWRGNLTDVVLRAFQGLLNEKRGATPGFLDSYVACLDEKYRPEVCGEYVEIQFAPHDWEDTYHQVKHLYREWRYDCSSEWSTSLIVRFSLFRSKRPIYLRAHRRDLEKIALESVVCPRLSQLTSAALRYGENEVSMIERYGYGLGMVENLRPTDPVWPESIMKGFNVDGYTYRVTIL
ncbi:heterokaryon incompatibility protein-domain-containing protein [Immersiella caudata]|uniref:Heterokaryon incompatibility protein-domain-containing protein n=1 Tax=Immersiella caudata TaxID=314043 RepID=A0AA39WK95_9PEZI|nr:heterokaryon incompatibility protein-domain-containing protein [Immersiella caudata]